MRLLGLWLVACGLWGSSDNFNRADGALGANWTTVTGALSVSGNQVISTVAAHSIAYWSADTFSADQYSQVTIKSGSGTNAPGPTARTSSGYNAYNCGWHTGNNHVYINRFNSGSAATLYESGAVPAQANDRIRLEITGTNPVVVHCMVTRTATGDVFDYTYNDSSASRLTTGSPGIDPYYNGTWAVDDWSGGNVLTITASSPLPDGTYNVPYSTSFSASGGTAPYSYSGTAPFGLSLSSGGTLSGTPAYPGTASFLVSVTDSAGGTGNKTFTLAALMPKAASGGPNPYVVLTNKSGGAQASAPTVFLRFFKQGEFPQYARPFVDGSPATPWQNDVKTRWRDKKATCPISGATNASPIVVSCANHGFRYGERVYIAGVGGNTASNGWWTVEDPTPNTFKLIGSAGNGNYTSGGTATGPAFGSIQTVLISFPVSYAAADSVHMVTFVNSANPCSSGNQASCDDAALDASGMLNFNGGNWDPLIQAVQNSTTRTASARTMITDGNFEYWARGPALTWVIAGQKTRTHDFGWTCSTNCAGDYSTATWTNDTVNRSIHPVFYLMFPNGWAGVRVDYVDENMWTTALQDQRYEWTLKKHGGTTVYGPATHTHYALTRLHRQYWDGAAPGAVKMDLNLDYMVYSGVIHYDRSKLPTAAWIASEKTAWAGADLSVNAVGRWTKTFGQTGGRPDLGPYCTWDGAALMSFDESLVDGVVRNARMSAHVPLHYRELATGRYHDRNNAVDAQYRVLSLNARPTACLAGVGSCSGQDPADATTPLAALSTSHGWDVTATGLPSHQPNMALAAYLLTGDPLLLEEIQFWASWDVGSIDLTTPMTSLYARGGKWGFIAAGAQSRGVAWGQREVGHAAIFTPDAAGEKEFYWELYVTQMAVLEGAQNTRGYFYDTGVNSKWQRGRTYMGGGASLGSLRYNFLQAYSGATCTYWTIFDCTLAHYAMLANSPWMMPGYFLNVWGHLRAISPTDFEPFHEGNSQFAVEASTHPAANPTHLSCYTIPFYDGATGKAFADWPAFRNAYKTDLGAGENIRDRVPTALPHTAGVFANWCTDFTGAGFATPAEADLDHGYPRIIRAAMSFVTPYQYGGLKGSDAWAWWNANVDSVAYDERGNNKWAYVPHYEPTRAQVSGIGDQHALLKYTVPVASEQCAIKFSVNADYSSPVISTTDAAGARGRVFVATGLTALTTYYWRVTCASDEYNAGNTDGNLTTLAAGGGASSFSVLANPPATAGGTAVNNCVLDYGNDASVSEGTTSPAACGSGLPVSISVPATSRRARYYRLRYRDAGGNDLARGEAQAVIAP